jgi:pyrroline-5-carboxylate reductase
MSRVVLDGRLVLVGAGKMGGAMLAGWIAGGLSPTQVVVQDPGPPADVAADLAKHGITAVADARTVLDAPPAVVVMAVKPQVMDAVVAPLAASLGPRTLVLSIAAGRTIASFTRHLSSGAPVIRAMPNTPAAIGRGITVCCANGSVDATQRALATDLLAAVGEVGWVEDEALIDAVTAVSGSGPAYVFLLAECLAKAGVEAGLEPALARRLADATVSGSGELLRQSGLDPAILRQNVTSPGGTTAAALQVLMAPDGLQHLMTRAVDAAARRGRDLAG